MQKKTSSWRTYTVQTIFSRFNWEGKPLKQNQAKTSNVSTQRKGGWKSLTVQTFFSRSNWQGDSKAKPVHKQLEKPKTLSLQLTVTEFFQWFTWEAKPQIGLLPQIEKEVSPQENSQDIKLTDLSQLF